MKATSPLAMLGMLLGLVVVILSLLGPLGAHAGWWVFRSGFTLLRWAVWISPGALLVSAVGVVMARFQGGRRALIMSLVGIVFVTGFWATLAPTFWRARTVPPIHDITTDTEHPPAFVAVLPLRQGAENSTDYAGAELAAQQKQGYPDLAPAQIRLPTAPVFRAALETAKGMGWEIAAAVPDQGRIEATDTTFWYAFSDDIVIRIQPAGEGSLVDVRSVSRVGRSDLGVNAKRIRAFLSLLQQRLKA